MISTCLLVGDDRQIMKLMSDTTVGERRRYRNYFVVNSPRFEEYVIELGRIVTRIPADLQDVTIKAIAMVKTDSPVTLAEDGEYLEWRGTEGAERETRCEGFAETTINERGVKTQYLHAVLYGPEPILSELGDWFYQLLRGDLNDLNGLSPIYKQ
jgi:hypothetical protein